MCFHTYIHTYIHTSQNVAAWCKLPNSFILSHEDNQPSNDLDVRVSKQPCARGRCGHGGTAPHGLLVREDNFGKAGERGTASAGGKREIMGRLRGRGSSGVWHYGGLENRRFRPWDFVTIASISSRVWINRVWLPILLVVSSTGENSLSLSPFARDWVRPSRPASACSFFTLRLNLVLTREIHPTFRGGVHMQVYQLPAIRHRVSPEFIGPRSCVPMEFTAESPPAQSQ